MAKCKFRIIAFRVSQYKFIDEQTNKPIEGCKIHYIMPDMPVSSDNISGYSLASGTLSVDMYNRLSRAVPAIFDGDFDMLIGQNGQPMLKLNGVDYVADFPFEQLYNIALDSSAGATA